MSGKINQPDSETGVTLLLSILILSAVTLISLSVAAFSLNQIRSSRSVVQSNSAISAAESAGEEGVWSIKRGGTTLPSCSSSPTPPVSQPLDPGFSDGAGANSCLTHSDATISLTANTDYVLYLSDPLDPSNDYDLQGCVPCTPQSSNPNGFPYSSLTVNNESSNYSVSVTVDRLDGTNLVSSSIPPNSMAPSPFSLTLPAPGNEARMKITLNSPGNAVVDITTDLGMPNYPTVSSLGCSAIQTVTDCNSTGLELFTRKINVVVPQ